MMGLLQAFGAPIQMGIGELKANLQNRIAEVQARVGTFLQQKQRIMLLSYRASALSKDTNTAQYSTPLLSRAQALLEQQTQLEKDSARFVQDANSTITQIQTDPLFAQISAGIMPGPSWGTVNKVKFMAETITNVALQLKNTLKRLDDHIGNVDALERQLASVESGNPVSEEKSKEPSVFGISTLGWLGLLGAGGFLFYKWRKS